MRKIVPLIAMVFAIHFQSCVKDPKPLIFLTPAEPFIQTELGEFYFSGTCKGENELEKLCIYLSTSSSPEVLDTTIYLNGNEQTFSYFKDYSLEYQIGGHVYIKFVVTDVTNSTAMIMRRIDFLDSPLEEYLNMEFYSAHNSILNSFDIDQMSPVFFNPEQVNLLLPDIQEYCTDTLIAPNVLSYRWYSPKGNLFAHVPLVNFDIIQKQDLPVLFSSTQAMSVTDSLFIGDCYVIKRSEINDYAIVKIRAISGGNNPGKYTFDMKR